MSLTAHPEWKNISPWIRIVAYDRDGGHAHPRKRINIAPIDDVKLAEFLQSLTMPCVTCGREIHPIRFSRDWNMMYVAVTCPLTISIACARARAASEEYTRIIARVTRESLNTMMLGKSHVE